MAHAITFSAPAEVNGIQYAKGDKLSVSDSLYELLKSEGKIAPERIDGRKAKNDEEIGVE